MTLQSTPPELLASPNISQSPSIPPAASQIVPAEVAQAAQVHHASRTVFAYAFQKSQPNMPNEGTKNNQNLTEWCEGGKT